jgi:serine/threonine-protein kinase
MDTDRWQRLQALFAEALRQPAAERDAWLRARCDDTGLRQEVLALLANDVDGTATAQGLVQREADELLAAAGSARVGQRFGAWEIVAHLADGGMGSVFRARRADGAFDQIAALKLLNPALLGADGRRRLHGERQILARLAHPGIARLIDGGDGPAGEPYLVMELVDGVPIDAHCRQGRLDLRARLRLFLRVCDAVDYAHRNLVVHRDIKPSNLLVAPDGTPKLLDFGISKLLDGAAAELTAADQRALTPAHASPEQIGGEAITTATDVYALGVLLYLLLTGSLPFPADGRSAAQLAQDILHRTPARPSLRAAGDRPPAQPPLLDGPRALLHDLDAIVLQALRKEPERRYSSVRAMADDIARALAFQPVQARPDDWRYRASRFLRRNALASAAAAAAVAMLTAFAAVTLLQSQRIERERQVASLTADFLVDLFTAANPASPQAPDVTARELLRTGAERVQRELVDAPAVQARLMRHLGAALTGLGDLEQGEALLRQAVAVHARMAGADARELTEAYVDLADNQRLAGRLPAALEALDQAWQLQTRLRPADDPVLAEHLMTRAGVLWTAGRHRDAAADMQRALAILERRPPGELLAVARSNFALVAWELGRFREARAQARQALSELREWYAEPHPYIAATLNLLGSTERRLGAPQQGRELHRAALAQRAAALGPMHEDVANDLRHLADSERELGRHAPAAAMAAQALAICEQSRTGATDCVADSLVVTAAVDRAQGRREAARVGLERAIDLIERHPAPSASRLANALEQLAAVEADADRLEAAQALLERARRLRAEAQGDAGPWVAATLDELALVQARLGRDADAQTLVDEAQRLRGPAQDDPTAAARGWVVEAELHQRRGDADSALALLDQAHRAYRASHGDEHPLTRDTRDRMAALGGEP